MFTQTHQIAGVTFHTQAETTFPFQDAFAPFQTNARASDVRCRAQVVSLDASAMLPLTLPPARRISRDVVFSREEWTTPLLRSPLVQHRLWASLNQPEHNRVELRDWAVTLFDFARREVALFHTLEHDEFLAQCYVGPSLFAPFLPTFDAMMLHSSAVVVGQVAALFFAPDEGGKTTVARTAPRAAILCDDQNIIRQTGNAFVVHSTPWGLYHDGPRAAPLGGMFFLEKADRFELIPLKRTEAMAHIWNEHASFLAVLPKHLRVRAFDLVCEACRAVPTYRMRFPKDGVDWRAIGAVMERTASNVTSRISGET
ncbi:MAG: hypothetical protein HY868_16025 [Chloroflexi bacterium]|nr:hypothetical protein [Chloroflexota bacterium]